MNHIWQVLLYARRVFYKLDSKAPLNPEAAVLVENDPDLFRWKAEQSVQTCKLRRYDKPRTDDPHAIR